MIEVYLSCLVSVMKRVYEPGKLSSFSIPLGDEPTEFLFALNFTSLLRIEINFKDVVINPVRSKYSAYV